jgi:hypothetical protein
VLDRALAAHPQERVFLDYLGTWHVRQSQDAEAEAAFRRSIALKPSGSVGYLSLNMVLMRKDRLDEALTVLQQGLQVRPNHRLYSNLGAALFLKGRYADAAEADERALTTLPQGHNDGLYQSTLAEALEHVPGQDARAANHPRAPARPVMPGWPPPNWAIRPLPISGQPSPWSVPLRMARFGSMPRWWPHVPATWRRQRSAWPAPRPWAIPRAGSRKNPCWRALCSLARLAHPGLRADRQAVRPHTDHSMEVDT